ncbi:hypothetical protein J6590_027559 [Homalodisca vitripennis]|nr:hypothetical protein J6590_027559 [Homalodisca vitripennis]
MSTCGPPRRAKFLFPSNLWKSRPISAVPAGAPRITVSRPPCHLTADTASDKEDLAIDTLRKYESMQQCLIWLGEHLCVFGISRYTSGNQYNSALVPPPPRPISSPPSPLCLRQVQPQIAHRLLIFSLINRGTAAQQARLSLTRCGGAARSSVNESAGEPFCQRELSSFVTSPPVMDGLACFLTRNLVLPQQCA